MQVIIAYCVVAVENHGRVAFGSREIIHGRSCRNFLACLDRKARDKAPQPVYQVHLRSGGEQVLKLAVVVVVYLPDVAADLRLERNAPDILPVLVLKADGEVAVLVDRVGFSGSAVPDLERAGRNGQGRVPEGGKRHCPLADPHPVKGKLQSHPSFFGDGGQCHRHIGGAFQHVSQSFSHHRREIGVKEIRILA